jgi:capsular polysaccharide biosynthesis protein
MPRKRRGPPTRVRPERSSRVAVKPDGSADGNPSPTPTPSNAPVRSGTIRDRERSPGSAERSPSVERRALEVVEDARRRVVLEPRTLVQLALYAVLIVLGASLAGYFVGGLGGTVRAARSEVLYELDAERPTGFLRQDRQLTTQLVTIRSRAVVAPVADASGLTFEELSDKLDVGVVDDSEVIRIEVTDGSGSRARALVDGITSEYLARVHPGGITDAREYLEDQLATVDERLEDLTDQLADLPSTASPTAEQTLMTTEMDSLFDQRADLQSRLEDIAVDELNAPQVDQITEAYVLDDPVSPRPLRAAIAGGLAGLMVAALAIAVLVRRRMAPREA